MLAEDIIYHSFFWYDLSASYIKCINTLTLDDFSSCFEYNKHND